MIEHLALALSDAGLPGRLATLEKDNHANDHFTLTRHEANRPYAFVKFYRGKPDWRFAEVAASAAALATGVRTPRLIAKSINSDVPWAAFEWMDLVPVEFSQRAYEAGELLREIHDVDVASAACVGLHKYRPFDQLFADVRRATEHRLLRSLMDRLAGGKTPVFNKSVLLHGDFGQRNIALARGNGKLVAFDFEHSRIGPPEIDLAKLWSRELTKRRERDLFLSGYGSGLQIQGTAMMWVRAWAMSLLYDYGMRHSDLTAIADAEVGIRLLQIDFSTGF